TPPLHSSPWEHSSSSTAPGLGHTKRLYFLYHTPTSHRYSAHFPPPSSLMGSGLWPVPHICWNYSWASSIPNFRLRHIRTFLSYPMSGHHARSALWRYIAL